MNKYNFPLKRSLFAHNFKRFICLALSCLLIMSICACTIQKTPPDFNENEKDDLMSTTKPVVSGTFMQPSFCTDWTADDFESHFAKLKSVGIDTFILQWTSTTPLGKIQSIFYDSAIADDAFLPDAERNGNVLEGCLSAGENARIKVFVGLNLSDEWWDYPLENDGWMQAQTSITKRMAIEMHSLYKNKYPTAFHGWYWAWEMSNGMNGKEKMYATMINHDLASLTAIDPTMPLLLSPFNTAKCSPDDAGKEWGKFFSNANFRSGDIFCCQDAVGAAWIDIDVLDDYFSAIKTAVDRKGGLHFWANSENFNSNFTPARLDRFYKQLQIASKYTEKIVSFSFDHYYLSPKVSGGYFNAYKQYFATLEQDFIPPADCTIEYQKGDKANTGNLRLTFESTDICLVTVRFNKTEIYKISVSPQVYSDALAGKKYILDLPLTYQNADKAYNFEIDIMDYWSNVNTMKYTAEK